MAMEFIEGVELRSMIGEGRLLPVAQAIPSARKCEGWAMPTSMGSCIETLSPANIMWLANGPVKITDFGIARMRASGELTRPG